MQILMDRPGMVVNGKTVYFKEMDEVVEDVRRVVKYSGKVNYVDSLGNFVCPKDYEEGHRFVHGFARVKENGLWGFVNHRGEEVCKCQFEKLRDYTVAYKNAKWFLIHKDGTLLNRKGYDEIVIFASSFIRVKQDGKYGFLNQEGKALTECIYDRILSTERAIYNGQVVSICWSERNEKV